MVRDRIDDAARAGIIAVGIGWLVSQGVVLGSGRQRGIGLQLLSVLLTLAAMAGAEHFILRPQVVAYVLRKYGAESAAKVPLFLPIEWPGFRDRRDPR